MAIRGVLSKMTPNTTSTSTSSRPHRGVDITYTTGTSTGTHLHADGYGVIPDWLNDRMRALKEEEYERGKRDALKKIWDLVPHTGETVILINSGEWIGAMGLTNDPAKTGTNQVIVHKDFLFPEDAGKEVPTTISMAVDKLELGWYQDAAANLYKYEGHSKWNGTDSMKNKELTEQAILGKLEYLDEN